MRDSGHRTGNWIERRRARPQRPGWPTSRRFTANRTGALLNCVSNGSISHTKPRVWPGTHGSLVTTPTLAPCYARMQGANTLADDPGVGKIGLVLVVLALVNTARCYNADLARSLAAAPIVGPMIDPPAKTPAYVSVVGTPAASALPETDFATWFPAEPAKDAYDPVVWKAIQGYMAHAGTQAGWTEVCKKISGAAGSDRSASPALGALACSDDGTVTEFQQFAAEVLATRAALALWVKGAPGGAVGGIQGRQGKIRILCSTTVLARQGAASPWGAACTRALDNSYLSGDGAASFAALGEAYTAAATEIAKLDPTVDAEPGYFDDAKKK